MTSNANITVILHRRQLDGDSTSALALTGPFTRSAPAPSVEAAVATVQQALPKDPVVVPSGPAPSSASALSAPELTTPVMLFKRIIRVVAFHKGSDAAEAVTHSLETYRDNESQLTRFFDKVQARFGKETDIPEGFQPLGRLPAASTQPLSSAQSSEQAEVSAPITATPEVRVATFSFQEHRFSRTLLMPRSVVKPPRECDVRRGNEGPCGRGQITAVYGALPNR